MRKDKKITAMLLLVAIVMGLTVGYAVLSSNLNINGSSTISNARWDIHFENIQTVSGSVTPSSAATINAAGNTITYAVTLAKPGDFYEFTVDVRNGGTIDGMIESVTSKINNQPITNLPAYLEYYVTYSDGVEIVNNHLLTAGTSEKYRIHVGFKKDINASDLPGSATTYNLSFTINETQANSSATYRPRAYAYYVGSRNYTVGEIAPTGASAYGSYGDAVAAFGHPIFMKYIINNNQITESYVGFVFDGKEYLLRTLGGTMSGGYCLSDSPHYATNRELLLEVFGSSNCAESNQTSIKTTTCTLSGIKVSANNCGMISSEDSTHRCRSVYSGMSSCTTQ